MSGAWSNIRWFAFPKQSGEDSTGTAGADSDTTSVVIGEDITSISTEDKYKLLDVAGLSIFDTDDKLILDEEYGSSIYNITDSTLIVLTVEDIAGMVSQSNSGITSYGYSGSKPGIRIVSDSFIRDLDGVAVLDESLNGITVEEINA